MNLLPILIVVALGWQTSQPPAPVPPKISHTPQEQSQRQNNEAKTEIQISGQPVTITVNQPPATQQAQEPRHEGPAEYTNTAINRRLLYSTIAIAAFTFGLLGIGWLQWRTYEAALIANKIIERAYVDLSHDPPGLQMGSDIRFSVAIKNHGSTPARVTSAHLILALGETNQLPSTPPYGQPIPSPIAAVVMPSEAIHQWELRPQFPPDVVGLVASGERHLWLVGYVDYLDQFGKRYRSGYARKYIPTPLPDTTNNLVFEMKPGYNYDTEIDEQGQPKDEP